MKPASKDIFETFSHHLNRGYRILVDNPGIRDITDIVRKAREASPYGSGTSSIPATTKYFGFIHPDMEDVRYVAGSSKSWYQSHVTDQALGLSDLEEYLGPIDKVAQRKLCEGSKIFRTVRYLDTGTLFTEKSDPILFEFQPAFDDFPVDEILSTVGSSEAHSYIFENMEDGFRVRTTKKGTTITGKSKIVRQAASETNKIKDTEERIYAFLGKLSESGYKLQKVGYQKQKNEKRETEFIEALTNHQGNLYVKGARTARGYMVVRIRNENGVTHVESDSLEFSKALESMQRTYDSYNRHLEGFEEAKGAEDVKLHRDKHDIKDPKNVLEHILKNKIRSLIVEEEIPFERAGDDRVEFRLICQKPEDEFEIIGYTKKSSNQVSVNISNGGSGEQLPQTLTTLFSQRHPSASESDLESMVSEAETDIMKRAKQFAEYVHNHNVSQYEAGNARKVPHPDFAIDIVPSWNAEKQAFDFYFLEINYNYGFSGLKEAYDIPEEITPEARLLSAIYGDYGDYILIPEVKKVITNKNKIRKKD